jgi:hypothetical protein
MPSAALTCLQPFVAIGKCGAARLIRNVLSGAGDAVVNAGHVGVAADVIGVVAGKDAIFKGQRGAADNAGERDGVTAKAAQVNVLVLAAGELQSGARQACPLTSAALHPSDQPSRQSSQIEWPRAFSPTNEDQAQ